MAALSNDTITATSNLIVGKGVDNLHDRVQLGEAPEGQLPTVDILAQAENVDIDETSLAKRRAGRTQVVSATNPHSFWVHPQNNQLAYYVVGGVLKKLNTDYTSTVIATMSNNNRHSYTLINGEVVVTNGEDIGWIVGTNYTAFAPTLGQFEIQMPAGQYCCYFRGSLVVAKNDVLYVSKPYNVEVADERYCMFPLDSYIRMVAPVEDGIWVGTSKHVGFIEGTGPDEWTYVNKIDQIVPDGCFGVTHNRAEETTEIVAFWAADGFYEGRAGGVLKNLSLPHVRFPKGDYGSCFLKENNGYYQYIAVIRNDSNGNVYVPDNFPVYDGNFTNLDFALEIGAITIEAEMTPTP